MVNPLSKVFNFFIQKPINALKKNLFTPIQQKVKNLAKNILNLKEQKSGTNRPTRFNAQAFHKKFSEEIDNVDDVYKINKIVDKVINNEKTKK